MKVKIGKKIYDSAKIPIMLILTNQDKRNIESMSVADYKYCCYPQGMSVEEVKRFMTIMEGSYER